MKQTNTSEKGLEEYITQYLVDENHYIKRENTVYDDSNCLETDLFFKFLEDRQPKALMKLKITTRTYINIKSSNALMIQSKRKA